MEVKVGQEVFYNGKEVTAIIKAQVVTVYSDNFFGFEDTAIIETADGQLQAVGKEYLEPVGLRDETLDELFKEADSKLKGGE